MAIYLRMPVRELFRKTLYEYYWKYGRNMAIQKCHDWMDKGYIDYERFTYLIHCIQRWEKGESE